MTHTAFSYHHDQRATLRGLTTTTERAKERAIAYDRPMYVWLDPVHGATYGTCREWNEARDVPERHLHAVCHPSGLVERLFD